VVQEKVQFPRKANGYHGVVPTAEVVVSLQDKLNKLKKKASAHQLFKKKKRRQNTLLTRTVIISVGRGLDELSRLLGRIRMGGLIMTGLIILALLLAAHGGAAKKEWGILILWPQKNPLSACPRAQLG
jgi:hypothetical protein